MENLKRLNSLTAIAPTVAAVAFAGAASAETIITEYGPLEITTYGDLTSDLLDENRYQFFDLNGDDVNDFAFSVYNFGQKANFENDDIEDAEGGFIKGLNIPKKVFSIDANIKPFGAVASELKGGFATEFFAGDTVGGGNNFDFGADLYRGDDGPLGEVGDTMFVGLALSMYPYTILAEQEVATVSTFSDLDETEELKMLPVTPFTTYGWAEFERGSMTLLRTGYNSTGGAALIPGMAAVPLPAPLLLLATGAAGLAAMRRRQRKAA